MTKYTTVQILDYIPHSHRSLEIFLLTLAEKLRARGWRTVHVFAGAPGEIFRKKLEALDSPYMVTRFQPSLLSAVAIGRRLRRYHPDVVQMSFMSKFSLALPAIKLAAGARFLVFTDRSSGFAGRRSRLGRSLVRVRGAVACRYVDRLVAVSEFVRRRDVEDMYFSPASAVVVHNGVDTDRFCPREVAPMEAPTLVYAGRLDAGKGVLTLLRAVAELTSAGERIGQILIAGRGTQEQELKAFCLRNRLDGCVRFLGQVDCVQQLFSTADVVVVPSEYGEAFGWVVAEAMACGSCLLVSDDGAIPEVVGPPDEAAAVFPAGNTTELAAKLRDLIRNPQKRAQLRTRARARAVERFSINRMVSGYAEVYDQLELELAPNGRSG